MPLRRFQRQFEKLSQFERGRIIGMMEARSSARRVSRSFGRPDRVVKRCWVDSGSDTCHLHEHQAHFEQDNARPHTEKVSQDCLRTVTTFPWPGRTPYLSPVEYIWDHLGWRIGHPTSLNELEARLQ
ncbi:transposable element Tcb2 transposase [Trichonephila clavipes]|nr:transposable element Tcb2 transposase [Trichonephila clavipes]